MLSTSSCVLFSIHLKFDVLSRVSVQCDLERTVLNEGDIEVKNEREIKAAIAKFGEGREIQNF